MTEIICTLRGLEFRPPEILSLQPSGEVELRKDPCGETTGQQHKDQNAVAVYWQGQHLGYISAQPEMQPLPTNEFLLTNWQQIKRAEVERYMFVEDFKNLPLHGQSLSECLDHYDDESSFFIWKEQKYWNTRNIGKLGSVKLRITLEENVILIKEGGGRKHDVRCGNNTCRNTVQLEHLDWKERKDYGHFAQSKGKCKQCGMVSYYPYEVQSEFQPF